MNGYRELCLDLPPEVDTLCNSVRKFAQNTLRPIARELDAMADPADVIAADSPLRRAFREAYRLGFHVASLPTKLGGLGLRGLGFHVFIEELSCGAVDLALSILTTSFPFSAAAGSGSRELYEEFVRPYVEDRDAKYIGCWGITEPQHGSDTLMAGTPEFHNPRVSGQVVARDNGDCWILNGQKSAWVTNGTIATHMALYLTIDPARGMSGGGIAFVPLNLPGVSRGKPLDKLGQRALNQGEVFFDEVRLPKSFMVTGNDRYEPMLVRTLSSANSIMATAFTGHARAAYEAALQYSMERVQGGKRICDHQLIQKKLFEMFSKVETCRALSRAVLIYNRGSGEPSIQHAIAAKTFCTQTAFEVASDAVQVFGGYGLSREYPVEKLLRDARAAMIEDGTNEVLSLTGARHILNEAGAPKSS